MTTAAGGFSPISSHSVQPSIIHCIMPGHSTRSLSKKSLSRSSFGIGHRERDQVEGPTGCFIDATEARLVVGANPELERWLEGEGVLAHEACTDRVSAS